MEENWLDSEHNDSDVIALATWLKQLPDPRRKAVMDLAQSESVTNVIPFMAGDREESALSSTEEQRDQNIERRKDQKKYSGREKRVRQEPGWKHAGATEVTRNIAERMAGNPQKNNDEDKK
jgi:hypothetical protein